MNALNIPIKRQRLSEWIKKQVVYKKCTIIVQTQIFTFGFKSKGMEKDIPC